MPGSAPVLVGDPELEYALYEAERRVRGIQAKLHLSTAKLRSPLVAS